MFAMTTDFNAIHLREVRGEIRVTKAKERVHSKGPMYINQIVFPLTTAMHINSKPSAPHEDSIFLALIEGGPKYDIFPSLRVYLAIIAPLRFIIYPYPLCPTSLVNKTSSLHIKVTETFIRGRRDLKRVIFTAS